jgi:serine/threonine protein kinase/predicted ATPase
MTEEVQIQGGYSPGTVFGGSYRIRRLIGTGGMGEVYEAEHMRTMGKLALKVLNPVYCVDDSAIQRFRREARITAALGHQGIVQVFDVDQDASGVWFIAMELLEGKTLKEIMMVERVLSLKQTLWIADKVCRALSHVHEKNVVHRDIKPGNIFVASTGGTLQVKLMDFGISTYANTKSRLSLGLILGTPRYMSPEQSCGEDYFDHRSDMFSLASVLYQTLAGFAPFDAKTNAEILERLLNWDPPPPSKLNREVPEQVDWAIMTALAKDPDRRFNSIGEFREAMCEEESYTGAFQHITQGGIHDTTISSVLTAPQISAEEWREMRRVTVLSASLEDDEETTIGRNPSNELERLMKSVGRMQEIIETAGGMVEKTFRSSLIAVFGVPKAKGDDAVRAIRAALALKEDFSSEGMIVRIGVSTGRVLAGKLIDQGGRYSVTGGALNLARRIQGVNDMGAVLVDHDTYVQMRGRFHARPVAVPGGKDDRDSAPLSVYEVLEEHPLGLLVNQEEVFGRPVDMVGRSSELERLKNMLHASVDGNAIQTALIVGATGMGKTRLVNGLRAYIEDVGMDHYTLMAGSSSHRAGIPYGLISEIIRTKAQVKAQDDGPAVSRKVFDLVSVASDIDGADRTFVWKAFINAMQGDFSGGDHRDIGHILRAAFNRHLGGLLKRTPVIIVLEDIEWADEKSLDVIMSLAESLQAARLFIVGTATPDVFERFGSAEFVGFWQNITRLQSLKKNETAGLLASIMGSSPSRELVSHMQEISSGNPLFIEEFIRGLADRNLLVFSDNCWQILGRDWAELLPGGVEAIVQSRLDKLRRDELKLVRRASVCGPVFWDGALGAMGMRNIDRNIESLIRKEFVQPAAESRIPGTREYTFKNAMAAKVAYSGLLQNEREDYHFRFAQWLETTGLTSTEILKLVAEHYGKAAQEEHAAMLYFELGRACADRMGDFTQALEHFNKSLDLARRIENRALQREALGQIGIMSIKVGHFDRTDELLRQALRYAAEDCQVEQEAIYTRELAVSQVCHGYTEDALHTIGRARGLSSALTDPVQLVELEAANALIYLLSGKPETAVQYYKRAIELAEQADSLYKLANILHNLGDCYLRLNDYSRAREYFDSSASICDRGGFYYLYNLNMSFIYYLDALQTSDEQFVTSLEECLRDARRIGNAWSIIQAQILIGKALVHCRRPDDARRYLENARMEAKKNGISVFADEAVKALKNLKS